MITTEREPDFGVIYAIDDACVSLYYDFSNALFAGAGIDPKLARETKRTMPVLILDAGYSTEHAPSHSDTDKLLAALINNNKINRELAHISVYERDVHALISCLQNRIIELKVHYHSYKVALANIDLDPMSKNGVFFVALH